MQRLTSNGCPYKGLQPYSEEDREYFFGRERDTEVIASNLYIAPLTILYGTSGVGKSSVLQAGVIPQLREDRRVIVLLFNNWQGENFHAALKETVLHAICLSTGKSAEEVLAEVSKELGAKEVRGLDGFPLDQLVTGCTVVYRRRLLMIFDQFEEYFLYHTATAGNEGFDAEFARAVNHPESGVNFMISMREEELSKLDRFRPRIANLLSNLLRLENLDGEAADNAIRKPLGIYNERHPSDRMTIEEDLITAIIQQVRPDYVRHAAAGPVSTSCETPRASQGVDRIETPFLQLVLMRLWEAEKQDRSRVLRLHTFEELGGALEIARTHLDKVMDQVTESQRATAAAVLRFLVTPTGSKIALDAASLASFANQREEDVLSVLDLLGSGKEMRILRKVTARDQPDRYELFHDVLGPAIIDWRSRYMQKQQLIEQRAEAEKAFSIERQKRLRQAVGVLVLLLVVMVGTTAYALAQRSEALEQKRIADDALKALDAEKKRVEKARDESDEQRGFAVAARQESDRQRQIAEAREQEAVEAKQDEAAARQRAESESKRANEQAAFAQSLVNISKSNLLGFDAARLGKTDESIIHFREAYKLSRAQKNNPDGEAYALLNMADGYGIRGGVVPLELLSQFDDYEGTKYEDFLFRDNYQLQSYGTNLENLVRQRKKELLEDQASAIESYQAAIDANRRQKPFDLNREAWIQQRIGDVYVTSQIIPTISSGDFEPDFSEAIKSYSLASDNYSRAGLPFAEGVMQTRIAMLAKLKRDPKPADLQASISAYKRARKAFENAGVTSREAATLVRIGESYKGFPSSDPEHLKMAIPYYSRGAALFDELGQFQKAAENYLASAGISASLPTPDKQAAFENYSNAMKAFQAAEKTLRVVNKKGSQDDNETAQIEKQKELLRDSELELLTKIGSLYVKDPKPPVDLKKYYNTVISTYSNDHVRRANVLHAIGKFYNNTLNDKQAAIDYYRAESIAWKAAGASAKQGGILVTIGNVQNELGDKPGTKASFEEARTTYREMTVKLNETERNQIVSELISIAKTYEDWGDNKLAFETYDQALSIRAQDKSAYPSRLDEIVQSAVKLMTEADIQPFFKKLTDYHRERGDTTAEASALERAAEIYAAWNKPEDALKYYNQALKRRPTPFVSLARIGKLYYDLKDETGAKTFFDLVIQSYRDRKDSYGEAYALSNIGMFYEKLGNNAEALKFYTPSVAAFCKLKNSGITLPLRALSRLFQSFGDTEEATRLNRLADDPATVKNCDIQIKGRP